MTKSKKCKCKKDYKTGVLHHQPMESKNGKIVYTTIFKDGEELYYKFDDETNYYFVAREKEKLRHIIYYSIDVEDISRELFENFFDTKIN